MRFNPIIVTLIVFISILLYSCNKRIIIYSTITSGLSSHPNTYNLPDSLTDGRFKFYSIDDSTQIRLKGGFKNGEKQGKWVEYYCDGNKKYKYRYSKCNFTFRSKAWFPNGQLMLIWKAEEEKTIYIKMFDEEGNKLTKEEFWNMYL
jgi:antitoxin component YwqK of YwqJK toxin-antitoxin module